ncbi:MAG: GxxExxY protein [Wenzhouxiangella sp.]
MQEDRERIEEVARDVVDAMVKVHRALGPGLLESAYQACLAHELAIRGRIVACETSVPIQYADQLIEHGFRADMIVDQCVLVENKAVSTILPVHKTQVFTYLKLSGLRLGLLANWNSRLMKDGITRIVNNL